jgi:toxin ParE1/3/4
VAGYYLSEEAHADLVGIALYTAERWGDRQEEIYIGRLYERFAALAENPTVGRACDDVRPGLRRVQEGSHVVFFERAGTELLIVRVLHQSMLPEKHFA